MPIRCFSILLFFSNCFINIIDKRCINCYTSHCLNADIAQVVERHIGNVEVTGPSPVISFHKNSRTDRILFIVGTAVFCSDLSVPACLHKLTVYFISCPLDRIVNRFRSPVHFLRNLCIRYAVAIVAYYLIFHLTKTSRQ